MADTRMTSVYGSDFEKEMAEFKAIYGFETWWPKGGYMSDTWEKVINYYEKQGEIFPDILKNVDYAIEGKGITQKGIELITEGIDKPVLALHAQIIKFIEGWVPKIKESLSYIESMAKSQPNDVEFVMLKLHDDIVAVYNMLETDMVMATDDSLGAGIPLLGDIVGLSMLMNLSTYPIYTVVNTETFVGLAQLLEGVKQAEEDCRETVRTKQPVGLVAHYMGIDEGEEGEKSGKGWIWVLGGGIVLITLGMFGLTVGLKGK